MIPARVARRRAAGATSLACSTCLACLGVIAIAGDAAGQPAQQVPQVLQAQAQDAPRGLVPPLVEHHHEAIYPAAELAERKHAEVVLIVTIDSAGHVTQVDVAQSGGRAFDDAATIAMREWTFTPAKRDGKPVAARIRVPYHFAPPEAPAQNEIVSPGIQGQVENAGASPPAAAAAKAPEPPAEEVRVFGRAQVPSRGAGDYEIPVGKLAAVPRMDSASLLRLAPGVLLTNEGGVGHPYQIFLRGFDAREGQDIEFSVDGIPINEVGNPHGNGVADTHFIIPELVQRLRVVEGPFAPQQGNFAVAGSALYDLGVSNPGLAVQAMAGSFNTKRLLLLWRPNGFTDHTFGGAEIFSTDGYGQNRAAERATAMGGFEGNLGETGSYRVLVTSYAAHYGNAGLLRADDVAAGRKGFYDAYDASLGGDSSRHSVGVTLNGKMGGAKVSQSAFLVLRDFRLRQNFTGFQEDPQQTWQSAHAQRGDVIDQRSDQLTVGGRGSVRQEWTVLGQKQQLELGYLGRFDKVEGIQQRDRTGTTVPYRTDLDLASGLTNIGLYADASVKPIAWITVRGGLRADLFHYRVTNRCALTSQSSFGGDPLDTECFASDRQGYRSPDQTASTSASLLQPRATILLGPFDGFTFSGSRGKGARSLDPQYINQDLKTPFAEVDATELGASFVRALGPIDLSARSVFFQTHVDHDLFFNQTEGRNTLSNGTTRTGWAGNARATGSFFDLAANLTLVRATFDDTHLVIPYAPDVVARADGVVFGDLPVAIQGRKIAASIGTGVSFVGARPLPFNEKSETTFLVDAGASLKWRAFALGLIATNLFDRKYRIGEYNYTSDFRSQPYPTQVAARHFTAGEPRAMYATLTVTLEGEGAKP
jgi:TonB family protein